MKSTLLTLSLLLALPVFGQHDCDPAIVDPSVTRNLENVARRLNVQCPHSLNPAQFCNTVGDQLQRPDPRLGTTYDYQNRIYEAACIQPGDSVSVIQAKVQSFWNEYHDQLTCNQVNSRVRNGNILKFAIEKNSRNFINDAVRRWGVSLNHVDSSDNQTVLDFIESEMQRTRGTPNEGILRRYFDLFRANGAKHRREL